MTKYILEATHEIRPEPDARSRKLLEYNKIIADLARHAHSSLGRERCLELVPDSDLATVQQRQAETDDAVKILLERGSLPLSGINDIRSSVARTAAGGVISAGELLRIGTFLGAVSRLARVVPLAGAGERIIYKLISRLQPHNTLEKRIDGAIAGDDELHDNASPALASIRRRIRAAQGDVKDSLNRIVRQHSRALQDAIVTLRGDRYVVPVKAEHRGDVPGLVHDTSASGATLFIEPLAVVELNNKIRELMGLEREEIDRILAELSAEVAEQENLLLTNSALLTEIDFIMAKGELALKMKAMPPKLNENGRICLKQARHPLIPADKVVPIDFEIGYEFQTLVITGPNTGGKTVSLKTCGLLTLMAMAGLQIPTREGSEISVFDDVLADIGDEQSIEQDLSTFSSHMTQIVRITESVRPRTLVLVDELGSGTDPSEGAALAIAILDYLRRKGAITVATTHYRELKGYALNTPGVENACCEFDTETLRPTYRLLIGVPGVSNAFAISSRLGLTAEIIEQARGLMTEEGMRFEDLIRNVERSRVETERLREEASRLEAEARAASEKAKNEASQLAEKRKALIAEAREEARERYRDAEAEIEQLIQKIRGGIKAADERERLKEAEEIRQAIRSGRTRVENEIGRATLGAGGGFRKVANPVVGEIYEAPNLGFTGKLIEGPDKNGNVILSSGPMQISVKQDQLARPAGVPTGGGRKKSRGAVSAARAAGRGGQGKFSQGSGSISMDRHLHAGTELMLLGNTVDEALEKLDKFIDDAVLTGVSSLRVVHGKGTGALRSAVQQHLKQDSRVKSFRLGAYGEGDSGVTLVELK